MNLQDSKNVLEAFKHYFSDKPPQEPDDLSHQNDAKIVIRQCIDSRLNEYQDTNMPRGWAFSSNTAAAIVSKGNDVQTRINLGFGVMNVKKVDTIVIMGHTLCGANQEIYKALLTEGSSDKSPEMQLLLEGTAEGLKEAVKEAKSKGASEGKILRIIEKTTTLQSVANLNDYTFFGKPVKDLINSGELKIIPAMRSLEEKDAQGRQKLFIFDPEHGDFRDIQDIKKEYDERTKSTSPRAPKPGGIVVQQGATSRTVAEVKLEQVKGSIKTLLQKMRDLEPEKTTAAKPNAR